MHFCDNMDSVVLSMKAVLSCIVGLDYPTFRIERLLALEDEPIRAMEFSPEGYLAFGGDKGILRIYKQHGSRWLQVGERHISHSIVSILWHPQASGVIVAGTQDGTIHLYHVERDDFCETWKVDNSEPVSALCASQDGRQFFIGHGDVITIFSVSSASIAEPGVSLTICPCKCIYNDYVTDFWVHGSRETLTVSKPLAGIHHDCQINDLHYNDVRDTLSAIFTTGIG